MNNSGRWTRRTGVLPVPILMLAMACCALFSFPHAQAQGGSTLIAVEAWSAVFGEQKITLHFRARGAEKPVRATWALAFEERVLTRGEAAVGPTGDISIPVAIPPVKAGVVLPLTLTVSIVGNNNTALASVEKRLWVYPTDVFANREEWLKNLKLRLYDPDGLTARRLDDAKIPYKRLGNADALAEGEPGIAIVGEGLSFEEYRGLPEAMMRAVAAGHSVLCLAPVAGVLPLPGSEGTEGALPSALKLRRADIISELDKRLDTSWPQGPPATSTLVLKASRNQVVVQVERSDGNWSWLECDYNEGRSALVVCSFNIMAQWDTSPTPRFLFARLLGYLDDHRTPQKTASPDQTQRKNQ